MSLMITADNTVSDHLWWKETFRIYAKPGVYFEIHCWSDEPMALSQAEPLSSLACYSLPDMKIVHGTVTESFISHILSESKPVDCQCYNKMSPFFTVRIGNHFSSEKYGTELILQTGSHGEKDRIVKLLSQAGQGISVFTTNT